MRGLQRRGLGVLRCIYLLDPYLVVLLTQAVALAVDHDVVVLALLVLIAVEGGKGGGHLRQQAYLIFLATAPAVADQHLARLLLIPLHLSGRYQVPLPVRGQSYILLLLLRLLPAIIPLAVPLILIVGCRMQIALDFPVRLRPRLL